MQVSIPHSIVDKTFSNLNELNRLNIQIEEVSQRIKELKRDLQGMQQWHRTLTHHTYETIGQLVIEQLEAQAFIPPDDEDELLLGGTK
jgi:hypothetical protein